MAHIASFLETKRLFKEPNTSIWASKQISETRPDFLRISNLLITTPLSETVSSISKENEHFYLLSTMGSTTNNSSKKSSKTVSSSEVYHKPALCSPMNCNKVGSSNIRQNLKHLSDEQEKTLARIRKLEEKIEKKKRSRASSTTVLDSELQNALDGLMKSMGNQNLLDWSISVINFQKRTAWYLKTVGLSFLSSPYCIVKFTVAVDCSNTIVHIEKTYENHISSKKTTHNILINMLTFDKLAWLRFYFWSVTSIQSQIIDRNVKQKS